MRTFHLPWLTSILLALVLLLGSAAPAALAQPEGTPETESDAPTEETLPSFLIHPLGEPDGSYFDVIAEPGTEQELTIVMGNSGTTDQSVRVYAADAYTSVNGGFSINDADTELTEPTTWLDFPDEVLDFEPGEGIERDFTLSVPEDTPPGEYTTGLVIQTAEPLPIAGEDALTQNIRRGAQVFITVPGLIERDLEITGVDYATEQHFPSININLENTGAGRVVPSGLVTVTDEAGEPVVTEEIELQSIFAGDTTYAEVVVEDGLPAGDYSVDVELADEEREVAASFSDAEITVLEDQLAIADDADEAVDEEAVPDEDAELGVSSVVATPIQSEGTYQYLDVTTTITNGADDVADASLTLQSTRDGETIEEYPLNPSFSIPADGTTISQRYIPDGGFQSGTYSFAVTLEVDGEVVATESVTGELVIP